MWDGQPALSPTLAEFLEAQIGQAPMQVRGVLDVLAVSEPLDADILATLTGPEAVVEAESLGLVRVDSGVRPAAVRLATPCLERFDATLRCICGDFAGAS